MPRTGRPPGPAKSIDELIDKLEDAVQMIQQGAHPELVARFFGVNRQTYWNWRKKAEAGLEPYASTFEVLLRAQAGQLCAIQIDMVQEHRLLPNAWLLERQRPDLFSTNEKLRGESSNDDAATTDADRLRRLAKRYEDSGVMEPEVIPASHQLTDGSSE